jgi:Protein of unknown function (DUF4446)
MPVVVALGLAVLALVVAVRAHLRISAVHARYRDQWDARERDLVAVVSHQTSKITRVQEDVQQVRVQLSRTADDVEQSLRHVALVRYDAFGDLSGQLSFSAAILDDHGDGLVISSVHALGESRTYAKGVIEGLCHTTLTHEEQQALAAAYTGKVLL